MCINTQKFTASAEENATWRNRDTAGLVEFNNGLILYGLLDGREIRDRTIVNLICLVS